MGTPLEVSGCVENVGDKFGSSGETILDRLGLNGSRFVGFGVDRKTWPEKRDGLLEPWVRV